MAEFPWRREDGAALVLALHVQPGAKRTEVAGTHGDAHEDPARGAAGRRQGERRAAALSRRRIRRAAANGDAGARRDVARRRSCGSRRRRCDPTAAGVVDHGRSRAGSSVREPHEIGDRERLAARAGIDARGDAAPSRRRSPASALRSVLRRCPNAAATMRAKQRVVGDRRLARAPSGTSRATADSTFGAGRNAPGGTMNSRVTANRACSITVSRP